MTKLSFFSLITNMGEINDSNKKKKEEKSIISNLHIPPDKILIMNLNIIKLFFLREQQY